MASRRTTVEGTETICFQCGLTIALHEQSGAWVHTEGLADQFLNCGDDKGNRARP